MMTGLVIAFVVVVIVLGIGLVQTARSSRRSSVYRGPSRRDSGDVGYTPMFFSDGGGGSDCGGDSGGGDGGGCGGD